jgi:predicted Rossmann fold flavoprotein
MSNEVYVIGCGAAGMSAAIMAAQKGARVTVLEGMKSPGKKLLLTGNGRCNLSNTDPDIASRYRSDTTRSPEKFTQSVFSRFSVSDTLTFLSSAGILTSARGEYLYPRCMQAQAVVELLSARMKELGVRVRFDTKVLSLRSPGSSDGKWQIITQGWTYSADRVILCAGSRAYPATGSDGSGYELASSCGHTIMPVVPALTALVTEEHFLRGASGDRTLSSVTLTAGERSYSEQGELQWTDQGISGIVVFNLSRYAARALAEGLQVHASIDLFPDMSEDELRSLLSSLPGNSEGIVTSSSVRGLLPVRLRDALFASGALRQKKNVSFPDTDTALRLFRHLKLTISGVRSYDQAQICAGGIYLSEVNEDTLESKLCPGLYFAGEILDIDGPCGGYNLQWAWSSGALAGMNAAR